MNRNSAALAFAALLALAAGTADAAAGKMLFVTGPVTVERPASSPLKQGDPVEIGDVIVTGEKARAQLLMNDGQRIALRSGTRYRIDALSLPAAVNAPTQAATAAAEGVSVSTLLKGGFRASTGAIGKDGKGQYEVRAPIGTLGIRGTDYTAVWCQGDCADVAGVLPGDAPRVGMYLAVQEGAIVFRHGGRESVVEAGQAVFIAAADAAPESLERTPAWLLEDGAGPLTTGRQREPASAGVTPDLSDRRDPPASGDTPPGTAPPDPTDPEGKSVQRPVTGTSGGQTIDLTPGTVPRPQGQTVPQQTVPPPRE